MAGIAGVIPSQGASYVTRFAPSPTGPLHLGHAYSALIAFERAKAKGGQFLLRIEDIDRQRSTPAWEAQIYDDLAWLGIRWPLPVLRQSDRLPLYQAALARLQEMGLIYACRCSRGDIRAALSAPQEGAPLHGPDGVIYPGTCRDKGLSEGILRLDMARAVGMAGEISFDETGPCHAGHHILSPEHMIHAIGDVVLARRDFGTSYHLSVVVDDAAQGVSEALRGVDLFEATPIHALLQRLLGLPQICYHHHDLIRDESGKRLAKRDDARAIAAFRAEGASPQDIRAMIGL